MTFPSNPNDNDIHEAFGRRLKYKESTSTWEVVSSPAVAIETEPPAATTAVATSANLPLTGNQIGAMSYSQDTNTLYVWNGTGWFKIALVNTNPTITDGGLATYELARDGTPTVVTLTANDPEGVPLTWSYAVTSGALEDTTVTNEGAVFTIAPGETAATFDLTFTASDGVNIDTSSSSFTLSFGPDWSVATQQKIQATDKQGGDIFGNSVAISGDTSVIGAPNDGNYYGSARIFTKSGSTWTQQTTIVPSDPIQYSGFGYSVAIDGDTAVVGAWSQSNSNGAGAGAVYVFTRSVSTWTQQAKLLASDAAGTAQANDNFGISVAIDGDTIAVGAVGAEAKGAAYIYTRSGTNWTEQAKLLPSDLLSSDNFGCSVSISGDTAVVGSKWQDTGGSTAGAAYAFVRSGVTWTQQSKIQASDKEAGDQFGYSVAIDGDTVVVGAPYEDTVASDAGAAYIFIRSGTTWTEQAKIQDDIPTLGDRFGWSVAISGDTAVVGNYLDDTDALANNGSACIFTRSGSTWSQRATLLASDKESYDQFGTSVAIDVDTAIIGAPYEDTGGANAGAAYIFQAG
jgi:hypothetical protein